MGANDNKEKQNNKKQNQRNMTIIIINISRADRRLEGPGRCLSLHFLLRFRLRCRKGIGRHTSPDGPWWLRGAICLAMKAPGELFGTSERSSGGRIGAHGCQHLFLRIRGATWSPQEHQKGHQGAPSGTTSGAKRPPKHPKLHLYIPNLDVSKFELPPGRNQGP